MPARRSLPWLILASTAAIAVGALLWSVLDEVVVRLTMHAAWEDPTYYGSERVGEAAARSQGWLAHLWDLAPLLLAIAVGVSLLINARTASGGA